MDDPEGAMKYMQPCNEDNVDNCIVILQILTFQNLIAVSTRNTAAPPAFINIELKQLRRETADYPNKNMKSTL